MIFFLSYWISLCFAPSRRDGYRKIPVAARRLASRPASWPGGQTAGRQASRQAGRLASLLASRLARRLAGKIYQSCNVLEYTKIENKKGQTCTMI